MGEALTQKELNEWLSKYDFSDIKPKTVGLILAETFRWLGLTAFLSVLFSGHKVLVKLSF